MQINRSRLSILTLACCALSLAFGQVAQAQQKAASGRATVAFHGLQGRGGYLRVALYDSPSGFPDGKPLARQDVRLDTLAPGTPLDSLTVTFVGLPPGAYAVCAFHDGRGSGKLATNFLGIPQEEWGMSNNPRPRFRAPRFEEARFGVDTDQDRDIVITLRR